MKKTTLGILTWTLLLSLPTFASASALHDAVFSGKADKVTSAFAQGAKANEADQYGLTALHYAADAGDPAMVKALIAGGANVNAVDPTGIAPLHVIGMSDYYRKAESMGSIIGLSSVAAEETPGNLEVVRLLLKKGAKIDQPDQKGQSPLHHSVERGMVEMAALLMRNGADPWLANKEHQMTPLHRMADRGYSKLIELALNSSPQKPVDIQDVSGCTPLHYIGFSTYDEAKNRSEMAGLTEGLGMLFGAKNESKSSSTKQEEVRATIGEGHLATAKLLLARGADVNRPASRAENMTPLHYAAEYGAASLAEILLANGAHVNAKNSAGQTPMDLARAGHHRDVAMILGKNRSKTSADPVAQELSALEAKARTGDAQAQVDLGLRYHLGNGLGQDFAKAVYWYLLAADQGHVVAQSNLAVLYTNGQGVQQNYKEAVRLYTLAADKGYALAQSNLGWMYHMGWGVTVDDQKAVALIQPVAEQGDVGSMVNLYNIYREKKPVQAFLWCKKAAEKGDLNSMTTVGVMYELGAGTAKNLAQAKYWYEMAAAKGEIHARENLRRLQ